jgi:6-phosphofructokinase 1
MEPPPVLTQADLEIATLGPNTSRSPLELSNVDGDGMGKFVPGSQRVCFDLDPNSESPEANLAFERAGPREHIFFNPPRTTAAIVTCGGLCPGLNNVIASVYYELKYNYGVKEVLGIPNGYLGLNPKSGLEPIRLTNDYVSNINGLGGTVLGSSRGPQDPSCMVNYLAGRGIDILFCVGGDGTQRGAHGIYEEITRRGLPISVVGIPKTIDNDIKYVFRTFGHATALEKAQEAICAAHVEARGAVNGIGLVKLMGRNAGFIAAGAAVASGEANFVLVPEIDFPLHGPGSFLSALEQRVRQKGHAVVVVAEGAGQNLFAAEDEQFDASGNKLHRDIGVLVRDKINAYFQENHLPVSLKYFDPSYLIRSVPANCADRILANQMARNAVHAAMAGNTDVLIGLWNNAFVHVPICTAIREKKQIDTEADLWTSVLLATGQPRWSAHKATRELAHAT